MRNSDTNHYDAIIIGSGMGGLTCASLLAQLDRKRVLVLERHFTLGGYTHAFKRKKIYEWDVGVHYVGEMLPGSHYRTLFDLVTDRSVDWQAMPDIYDRFVFPDLVFDARCGMEQFRRDLINQFPDEKQAIEQYFVDVIKAARWFGRLMLTKLLPNRLQLLTGVISGKGKQLALMTTGDYLNSRFNDKRLRAVLASQWGDLGLPPALSALAAHALITCHYFGGGYYPMGGASKIADSIVPIVEQQGGALLPRHRVEQIIVENGRAVGVKASTREKGNSVSRRFYADTVISDAGAFITFEHLLPTSLSISNRPTFEQFKPFSSHVCLYIGFKDSPAKLGFNGENLWIYDNYDHDAVFAARNRVVSGDVAGCFLSFPSLKNPLAKGHTAELISFTNHEPFADWSSHTWKKRGEDYDAVKDRIANGLISFVDQRYPGFKQLIDYQELSTPLTTQTFTGHHEGCIYGLPATPEKFSANWLKPKTPIKGLYLTGSDIAGHGIVGALMGGVMTTLIVSERRSALIKMLLSAKKQALFSS